MNKDELKTLMGKIIRIEREKRGITREELAKLTDITHCHMGLIERGERGVTCLNLVKFSHVFDLPINSFFQLSEEEEKEYPTEEKLLRKKLIALTSTSSQKELEFIIDMIQHIRKIQLIS